MPANNGLKIEIRTKSAMRVDGRLERDDGSVGRDGIRDLFCDTKDAPQARQFGLLLSRAAAIATANLFGERFGGKT